MQSPLPLHRRERSWYGQRSTPATPRRHADAVPHPEAPAARIPALRIAQIGLEIGQAPVDRRLTDLL